MDQVSFEYVDGGRALDTVRELFIEYAKSLNFSLCFQGFDEELRELPGCYSPPAGRLLLAALDGTPAGCIALKRLEPGVCEMKRLYVRPEFRRAGLGRQLVERLIQDARACGYTFMRLDTIAASMEDAVRLYKLFGFREIPPYYANPLPGAAYFELTL